MTSLKWHDQQHYRYIRPDHFWMIYWLCCQLVQCFSNSLLLMLIVFCSKRWFICGSDGTATPRFSHKSWEFPTTLPCLITWYENTLSTFWGHVSSLSLTHSLVFPPTNNTFFLFSVHVASSPIIIMRNYLLTVFAPRAGHCRVAENQSFHWLAEGAEAILPLPTCHQVGNRTHPVWEQREATVWRVLNYSTSAGVLLSLPRNLGLFWRRPAA